LRIDRGLEVALHALDRRRRRAVQRFDHGEQGVGQSGEPVRREHRGIGQGQQPGAQRHEVPGQVAAVHGRNVARRQRLERARVVPVEEVPLVALHRAHRREGIGGALDQLARRDVAEVVRREVRQQRKSHVGGRRAMRDGRDRMLLPVVRGKPVVLGADEGVEEGPRPPCEPAQVQRLRR
jgi:hypothetical protein